ncbi:cysteine desulfurase-like protein [Aureispira anguillae]|uniref:Cysteine desulfurase-like protein n=1 Tax=Aureispira anguillae TaxID=2864201 RepID=A0A916DNY6_9BACT|nr:cysteine desulfurase-like protein [Aureispira anguillae]BDS09846.1 cysteine desulfurase-like protein [Aureispira anguillae]
MKLDLDFVRKEYPSLREDYVFFDNAGGSQTLQRVMNKITEYYMTSDVQLGASYSLSTLARERVNSGTAQIAKTLNTKLAHEAIIGSSSTALIRLFSIVIGQTLKAGDEIIISNADHEANISPWKSLAEKGIVIKIWEFNTTSFRLELEDLKALMTSKTKLVAFCHVSNIFGTIHPVKEITAYIHSQGALSFVDGVAYAPHRLPDVQELNVDFYVYSIYKVFGPHIGVLYGKEEHLLRLPGINHSFIPPDDLPYKFQPGGPNYELTYSLNGIVEYLQAVAQHHGIDPKASVREQLQFAYDLFDAHEELLVQRLLDFLMQKPNVRLIGEKTADKAIRVSTIAFVVNGMHSSEIDAKVAAQNIGIKTGNFYAKGITKALDLDKQGGVVRVSIAHYNTLEELERLIAVFEQIL